MAISSINFKPIKGTSEAHNLRQQDLNYVYSDLSQNNESWVEETISNKMSEIKNLYKIGVGQKMQKKTIPIREAVLNLNANHTMSDLKTLAKDLEDEYGMHIFQIHIHRDEGKTTEELNYHAHILADWQYKGENKRGSTMVFSRDGGDIVKRTRRIKDKLGKYQKEEYNYTMRKGSMWKYSQKNMSDIQTLVAKSLGMERGTLKSTTRRLEALEYKHSQELKNFRKEEEKYQIKISSSQDELDELQKKNRERADSYLADYTIGYARENEEFERKKEEFTKRRMDVNLQRERYQGDSREFQELERYARAQNKELKSQFEELKGGNTNTREEQIEDYIRLTNQIGKAENEYNKLRAELQKLTIENSEPTEEQNSEYNRLREENIRAKEEYDRLKQNLERINNQY